MGVEGSGGMLTLYLVYGSSAGSQSSVVLWIVMSVISRLAVNVGSVK